MISFVLGGRGMTMPLSYIFTLGAGDANIASSILIHNGWLWRQNPMMAMYLQRLI